MARQALADPLEEMIAQALDTAGLAYVTGEGGANPAGLDFLILSEGVHIEVKRFHSARIAEQMSRVTDVIAVQGKVAVEWFARAVSALAAAARAEELEGERDDATAWTETVERHGTDGFDALADQWLAMESIQRMHNAVASVFSRWADDKLMARFKEHMTAIMHQAFVEGCLVGVRAECVNSAALQDSVRLKDEALRPFKAVVKFYDGDPHRMKPIPDETVLLQQHETIQLLGTSSSDTTGLPYYSRRGFAVTMGDFRRASQALGGGDG